MGGNRVATAFGWALGPFLVLAMCFGCDDDPATPDAARPDAASAADAASLMCTMKPRSEGCPCEEELLVDCGAIVNHCCDGRWIEYFDGACWSFPDAGGGYDASAGIPDAGPMDCDPPHPGCPCAEGETACRRNAWMLVCNGGLFVEDTRHACCLF